MKKLILSVTLLGLLFTGCEKDQHVIDAPIKTPITTPTPVYTITVDSIPSDQWGEFKLTWRSVGGTHSSYHTDNYIIISKSMVVFKWEGQALNDTLTVTPTTFSIDTYSGQIITTPTINSIYSRFGAGMPTNSECRIDLDNGSIIYRKAQTYDNYPDYGIIYYEQ